VWVALAWSAYNNVSLVDVATYKNPRKIGIKVYGYWIARQGNYNDVSLI